MFVSDMTRKELYAVAKVDRFDVEMECSSIVILPGTARQIHDSGYRVMSVVAVSETGEPIGQTLMCSDLLHIGGIGGERWHAKYVRGVADAKGWSIDCLPKSGLLRLFCGTGRIRTGASLSSMDIIPLERSK